MPYWNERTLHFIGIGGAGMSGLALVCHQLGATVSGSDRADSSYLERLRAAGLEPALGHDAANLPEHAEVVVSTAIGDDNPELALARERGQRVLHRGELLAELCAERRLLAIAGTHGKTTTTAMVVWALRAAGADPAFFLGGELPGAGPDGGDANAGWGEGEWVVAEADESDASFLHLHPEVAVVTNVEMDHHSRWGSRRRAAGGVRPIRRRAARGCAGPRAASSISSMRASTTWCGFDEGTPGPAELRLSVPGRHNLLNARAALAACSWPGSMPTRPPRALGDFPGVRRRLELKGSRDGARIYDDYAHHPTEVRAALEALRGSSPGGWSQSSSRICTRAPRRWPRSSARRCRWPTRSGCSTSIRPARSRSGELAGVSGLQVAAAAADRSGGQAGLVAGRRRAGRGALAPRLGEGDVLVTIGAGDIFELAERLVAMSAASTPAPPAGVRARLLRSPG